ncbi:hypothetical protein L1887_62294 [Cichorium endivia]|nr:hypothetical protein L1887_62294 [Cichorium endivia]
MWKRRAELPDERMRPSAAQPRSRDGASERALGVAMRCGDYRYLGLQLLGLSESMGRRCAAAKPCLGSGLGSNCRSTCRASSVERRKLVIHPCSRVQLIRRINSKITQNLHQTHQSHSQSQREATARKTKAAAAGARLSAHAKQQIALAHAVTPTSTSYSHPPSTPAHSWRSSP